MITSEAEEIFLKRKRYSDKNDKKKKWNKAAMLDAALRYKKEILDKRHPIGRNFDFLFNSYDFHLIRKGSLTAQYPLFYSIIKDVFKDHNEKTHSQTVFNGYCGSNVDAERRMILARMRKFIYEKIVKIEQMDDNYIFEKFDYTEKKLLLMCATHTIVSREDIKHTADAITDESNRIKKYLATPTRMLTNENRKRKRAAIAKMLAILYFTYDFIV